MLLVIGRVALALAVVLLFSQVPPLGAALLLFGDSLASATRWVGVERPAVGWFVLGVLGGAAAGVFVGMRRSGMSVAPRRFGGLLGVAGAALLYAGGRGPTERGAAAAVADRAASSLDIRMRVAAARATVRAGPSSRARIVGTLPQHTRLTVVDWSGDSEWALVRLRGRPTTGPTAGWVPSGSLTLDMVGTAPVRAARRPDRRRRPAPDAQSAAGEAGLDRDTAPPGTRSAVASQPPVPDAGAPAPRPAPAPARTGETDVADDARSAPGRAAGGFGGDVGFETPDGAVVEEVRRLLANARASGGGGDFAAALRALAAADEEASIAVAKYGQTRWIAALQRDAAVARAAIRADCQVAAATASTQGERPPLCE